MLRLLCPDEMQPSLHAIDLDRLRARGIRALVLDLDNTLAKVDSDRVSEPVAAWVKGARERGFRLCIASNAFGYRVRAFEQQLGVPALSKAVKPLRAAFDRALACLGTEPSETAIVGDQLFTDVLGGNRAGLYTILINPLSPTELIHTRIIRRVERFVLAALRRRQWISGRDWAVRCGGEGC